MVASTRWILGGIAGIVALAILAVIVSSVRDPVELPRDEPAGVVQRYLQAVAYGELETALDTYTDELRERCDEPVGAGRWPHDPPAFRADLLDTEPRDGRALVTVEITEFRGEPPFGDSGYDHTERFVLEREDGVWRITDSPWPYLPCPARP